MKKFRFRLQKVVEVRETKEKECQRELSLSLEELERRQKKLEAETMASTLSEGDLRKALCNKSNAGNLSALDSWRSQKKHDVQQQNQRTEVQRSDVKKKRHALIQASKEKKILERLRERRHLEHQEQQQREEQTFLDELGSKLRIFHPDSIIGFRSEDSESQN